MNRSVIGSAILGLQLACGSDVPTAITEAQSPAAAAVATATPSPTSTPSGRCANGESFVKTFDIKVFSVIDQNGELRPWDGGLIYVGETVRFDSQGHDRYGLRTNGCSAQGPRWDWDPEELVSWNGDFGWNPRVKVLKPGRLTVWAEMDGVQADFKLVLDLAR